jgi:light-regulated signal transduction histidine kinase (bacteriophytochrome)
MLAQLLKREIERDKALDEIRDLNASLERKVAERTELLESANKELESFSYSVSHDLRAPLRHINGYLELLQKKNSEQLDEKGKHYISSIYEASNHMGHLIDDLLNFSRSGRVELKPDNIDMDKAVKDALMILDNDIKGRNIVWNIDSLPFVHADYSMIRQVWVNLLGNAVKYTKFREVAYISVGWSEVNGEYVFFVKDNGAGFDSNYAQKLFGVFQRLHSNEEFEGTGIGLANVRQVIKRHGGRTWAEGEVDKGAVFYFTLPKK